MEYGRTQDQILYRLNNVYRLLLVLVVLRIYLNSTILNTVSFSVGDYSHKPIYHEPPDRRTVATNNI